MSFQFAGVKIGRAIARGPVKILGGPTKQELKTVRVGDIVVVESPVPEYLEMLEVFAGVIADTGNTTSHMAICLRERGKPGWFGVGNATRVLKNGEVITVNCSESAWESFLARQYLYGSEMEREHARRMLDVLHRDE